MQNTFLWRSHGGNIHKLVRIRNSEICRCLGRVGDKTHEGHDTKVRDRKLCKLVVRGWRSVSGEEHWLYFQGTGVTTVLGDATVSLASMGTPGSGNSHSIQT